MHAAGYICMIHVLTNADASTIQTYMQSPDHIKYTVWLALLCDAGKFQLQVM
jgi:hypothetical protein